MAPQSTSNHDLVCLSHLRWNFVFQRPQHLMSRFARQRRVFFIEEPVFGESTGPELRLRRCPHTNVEIVVPHIPDASFPVNATVCDLLAAFLQERGVRAPIAWFYTPMALDCFPDSIKPSLIVYDCMDELSAFRNAPAQLREQELRLMKQADVVFTGGVSLFEAKRTLHPRVHAFPSGVDVAHFAQARSIATDPADQESIARPRLGFAGVIDERMDLELVRKVVEMRPEWQLIMIGPVVKIAQNSLPRASNIHWLGMKNYQELPSYFAGWDVAIMPFAINESTRFISPTKTPEFLSAGLPVVSTPIRDVVRSFGDLGLARIAHDAEQFVAEAEHAMAFGTALKWRERIDEFLQTLSWDATWASMNRLIATLQPSPEKPGPQPDVAREAAHV